MLGRAWRSLRTTRQRVEAGVAFTAAVACIVAAGLQVGPALAETKIEGKPVPPDVLAAIVIGTTACPTLTGPRLAAQLMAASEFEPQARTPYGEGLAGMDAQQWQEWAPWVSAQRDDVRANVLAIAHRTCAAVGQARSVGVSGDLWKAAVAAERVDIQQVIDADGVPEQAREHVDTVVGYANWYADQPQFAGADEAAPAASPASTTAPVTVPEEYVELVHTAGNVCPDDVSAAQIAAQLMAVSGFDPNLKGDQGGQGIAQFTEAMWDQYRPSRSASVWDPVAAIPALGSAMCDLTNQLSNMKVEGTGSYELALAAYQWGTTAVRAAGGVPRQAAIPQLVDLVAGYVDGYLADERLVKPSPSPSASPSPSLSPSPSPSPSGSPQPGPGPTTTGPQPSSSPTVAPKPQAPKTTAPPATVWDPTVRYQFTNVLSGKIMEVPGLDDTTIAGVTVQLWRNNRGKDQHWHIIEAPDPGWVVIKNAFNHKALGIMDASVDDNAKLILFEPNHNDHNQQWKLERRADGSYNIRNRHSNKVLDILGDDINGSDGTPINQWTFQDHAVDQRWTLSR
ncbi:RICIN domain-containing protein [Solwaraspora sp. WMMD791]|uniref:RICIN domain-containing protein n=1 Tax=Solwaraspora sp. WMMD791 TaxID=3016086 RepID=UPI002499E705|nr:RICIN domain-containing protein [Solwaraspora sp. WMMD791]WFE25478.1 RICIN domain-containing protein [Solwaraspora sp. WMMD791]